MDEIEKKIDDDYFTMFPNIVLDNEEFRKTIKGPFLLYMFLLRRIVRWRMKDGLCIYEHFHRNGYLACSMSYTYLSKALNASVPTVKRWVKYLESNSFIKISKTKVPNKRQQNVYILGTHNGFTESFSIKEIYSRTSIKNDTSY